MKCSLNCFCDFFEAQTAEKRAAVVKQYKKTTSGPAKGMMVYYKPAFSLIRGFLCPNGVHDEKLTALRHACVIAKWPEKLNEARAQANTRVYNAFRSLFAGKKVTFLSNPRMQFLATAQLAVNLQPDLYIEVDGTVQLWKFGTCLKSRKDRTIAAILRMFEGASSGKGLTLSPEQIRFFDTATGKVFVGQNQDADLTREIQSVAAAFAETWSQTE